MNSNAVPAVTRRVATIVFIEIFSPRKRIAIIAEKMGVMEVRGATMLMLVESRLRYSSVSPSPKAVRPLINAIDS
jgi:hypothetical protein